MPITLKNFSKEYKRFCEQLDFDPNLKDYKDQLVDWQKLDDMLIFQNQFFYITDFTSAKIIYVHPNITKILGYSTNYFKDFGSIYDLINPGDSEFVHEITQKTIQVSSLYKNDILREPFKSLFSIDFRVKHIKGNCLKLNRQACCFKSDNDGNMVLGLSLFTDVTNINRSESYNIYWLGNPEYLHHFDDILKKYQTNHKITKKEKIILGMLATGKSATVIAKKLSLSVHTIISHRKNLLRKTSTHNTAELVKFAVDKAMF